MTVLPRNYHELGPTILEPETAHKYVNEILEVAENSGSGIIEIAEALYEIGVRLSDQYQIYSKVESLRIMKWVESVWCDNKEDAESLIPLFYMIDTRADAIECLRRILKESKNVSCKKLLSEMIDEIN